MLRHVFSTATVEPGRRLAYWNDLSASVFGPVCVDSARDDFHGEIVRLMADRCEITSIKSTSSVVRDAWSQVRCSTEDAIFRLQLTHSGECRLSHCGHDELLRAGDFAILDISKPFKVAFDKPLHTIAIHLPSERFASCAHDIERLTGVSMSGSRGAGAVLSTFLRSTWDHIGQADLDDWPPSAPPLLWDLIEAVCKTPEQHQEQRPRSLQYRLKARAFVDQRLCDPQLNVAEIATALSVSERYVYLLFAEVGTTPSHFILNRRLDLAAECLRRGGHACTVTQVAMDVGFNDLSHFSRVFRKRFGQSPCRYKASFSNSPAEWL
jgi:AraC family transcriptional activator of tynA and feaB